MKAPKVALYARISTSEGRQHLENQLRELRRYARGLKWKVAYEFTDELSGAKDERPGLLKLLGMAAARRFEIVLVYDLSRLTRRGPASAFYYMERLKSMGVELWSMREEYFRTSGPAGPILIAIAAFLAEREREAIRDRVNAGLSRARAAGIKLGRQSRVFDRERLRELRAQGNSLRACARLLKISKSTVLRALRMLEHPEGEAA